MEKPPLESGGHQDGDESDDSVLGKISRSKAGSVARAGMLAGVLAGTTVACSETDTVQADGQEAGKTEQVEAGTYEQHLHNGADKVVQLLQGLEASARQGGLGERMVQEDLIKPYVTIVATVMHREQGTPVTSEAALPVAYGHLRDALDRYESEGGDMDNPGVAIMKRILNTEAGAGAEHDTSEGTEQGKRIESAPIDTSAY